MSTRQRILDVASVQFAARGLHGTRVRDLCTAADVNIAAVNYHFGDKASLYAQVLLNAYQSLADAPMPTLADADPVDALHAWVLWYVRRLTASDAQLVDRLMVHERSNPTGAMEQLVQRGMQPVFDALRDIIAAVGNESLDQQSVSRIALSVVGQCLIYRGSTGLLEQLEGVPSSNPEAIADHVTTMTIAGIRQAAGVS